MMYAMAKETRLNLRISDAFRQDIETLAEYHGLSMSSYAHSLLVRAVRREKEAEPQLFPEQQPARKLAPVAATITPSEETLMRKEIAAQLTVPVLKKKTR